MKLRTPLSVLAPVTLLCASLFACAHEQDTAGTTSTTSGEARPTSTKVVERLASTRCDREQRCDNVGAGHTYASRDACLSDQRGKWMNDLNSADCPRLNDAQVQKCLDDIRNQACENAADWMARVAACQTSALCGR